ncbi:MAG TPA: GtrA family protein [Ruminiclostridium sp.]|nr:GtrA family protein [Ruminiclostridium sp.]
MGTFGNLKDRFGSLFGQMVKYGLVGVVNTVITMIILFLLQNVFGVSYKIANGAGYVAGFINSFVLNKFWTFKGNQKSTFSQFIRFALVFAVCYAIQLGLVVLLVEKVHIGKNISQLIGMVFYTLVSFLLNKLFTFKD